MQQWLVLSITRRERKQTSYYRIGIFLLHQSSKQACMGVDFNCSSSYRFLWGYSTWNTMITFNRQSIRGIFKFDLLYPYIKCKSFNVPPIILFVFKPKDENLKQQLTILCTGKYMWLMCLFNFDKFYEYFISNFY